MMVRRSPNSTERKAGGVDQARHHAGLDWSEPLWPEVAAALRPSSAPPSGTALGQHPGWFRGRRRRRRSDVRYRRNMISGQTMVCPCPRSASQIGSWNAAFWSPPKVVSGIADEAPIQTAVEFDQERRLRSAREQETKKCGSGRSRTTSNPLSILKFCQRRRLSGAARTHGVRDRRDLAERRLRGGFDRA